MNDTKLQWYKTSLLSVFVCVCVCVFRFKRMENPFHEGQKTKVVKTSLLYIYIYI
jgi:hypothetical protein